jgi:hypothetical protein
MPSADLLRSFPCVGCRCAGEVDGRWRAGEEARLLLTAGEVDRFDAAGAGLLVVRSEPLCEGKRRKTEKKCR